MNENRQRPEPPDLKNFHENWRRFPQERLVPYQGKYVAWSPDGKEILASGDSEEEVQERLGEANIDPSQVVGEHILPSDITLLGGLFDIPTSTLSEQA
jgi:hypothetical protein